MFILRALRTDLCISYRGTIDLLSEMSIILEASHPQPWDNSQRIYTVDDSHITRRLVKLDDPAVGFYALAGESVLSFPTDQTNEEICLCLEQIREQNLKTDSVRLRQLLFARV